MVVAVIVGMSIFFKVKPTKVEESVSTNEELKCFADYLKTKKRLDKSFPFDTFTGNSKDCENWILQETNIFLSQIRKKLQKKILFYPTFPYNPIENDVVECLVDQFKQGNYADFALIKKVHIHSKQLTSDIINGMVKANEKIIDNKLNNEFYVKCARE
ncbi:unnamed protein product [Diamesa tonsa]